MEIGSYKGTAIQSGSDAFVQQQIQNINKINSSNLTNKPEIPYSSPSPTPVYDVSRIETPKLEITSEEQKAKDLSNVVQGLTSQLSEQSSFTENQKIAQDITGKTKTVNDLSAQLNALKNEALAIPLQLEKDVSRGGVTQYQLGLQQSSRLRDNAIASLAIYSQLQAAQGNLALANDLVDRAVAQKFDPIKASIQAKRDNLAMIMNSPDYTIAEKNRAQTQLDYQNNKEKEIQDQENNQKEIYKIAITAAENGADAVTLQKITKAKTKEDALRTASSFMQKPKTIPKETGVVQKFNTDLSKYTGTVTREVFARQLQLKYPDIEPDDISRKIYETYPDNWEKKKEDAKTKDTDELSDEEFLRMLKPSPQP